MCTVLKKTAKRLIFCAQPEEELLKQVEGKETVSLNVFDTVVKREVAEPKGVFELIESRLGRGKSHAPSIFMRSVWRQRGLPGRQTIGERSLLKRFTDRFLPPMNSGSN